MKKFLMDNETLFKNIEVFDSDYIPEEFEFRDNQIKALSMCIKPALRGSKASNALIIGTTATGKTTSIKLLLAELQNENKRIIPVHINCQIYSTEYKIFSEIHKKIFGYSPPPSGISIAELFEKIFSYLAKNKQSLLVILDDCEIIFDKNNSTIYDIMRGYELYQGAKSSIWCITHKNFMHMLEDKSRSVFNPEIIEYQKYTHRELVEILSKRVEYGLYKDVISKDLIEVIAENCFDLRHGIEYIKRAAVLAESEASKTITEKHVRKVLGF